MSFSDDSFPVKKNHVFHARTIKINGSKTRRKVKWCFSCWSLFYRGEQKSFCEAARGMRSSSSARDELCSAWRLPSCLTFQRTGPAQHISTPAFHDSMARASHLQASTLECAALGVTQEKLADRKWAEMLCVNSEAVLVSADSS